MVRFFVLIITYAAIAGCSSDVDGKYCKLEDGEIRLVVHRFGDLHFLRPVDIKEAEKVLKLSRSGEIK